MPASPALPREVDVLRTTLDLLTERLPTSWTRTVRRDDPGNAAERPDAVIELRSPDGADAAIVMEAKRVLQTGDAGSTAQQAIRRARRLDSNGGAVAAMVVARYLSPPARRALVDAGVGYADATGNLFVQLDRPALYLRDVGADRDPWRGPGRPRGNLRDATAIRLARALADFTPPYSVPELAKRSGASVGATYRMVKFLEQEGLLTRAPRGPITDVDWRGILERRGTDVGTSDLERTSLYLEPRGIPELLTKLRASKRPYVLTGTLAARYYDDIVPPRLAMIYTDPVEPLVEELNLRPSPSGNVLVGPPADPVVFERAIDKATLWVAAPSQVAIDLLGGPGRGPAEATMLLDWMERNTGDWRQ